MAIPRQLAAYFDLLAEFQPALVISDFDSWTYLYARLHGLPIISIDNMQLIDRCRVDADVTQGQRVQFELARAFVASKLAFCEHYYVEDQAGSRPPQRLVRGGGHDVEAVIERVVERASGDQPTHVRDIGHRQRAHVVCDAAERGVIVVAWVRGVARRARASDDEYRQRGIECSPKGVRSTPWGTREFALYDLDRNSLTFCRALGGAELENHPR